MLLESARTEKFYNNDTNNYNDHTQEQDLDEKQHLLSNNDVNDKLNLD